MIRVGLISDTHNLLRPEARAFLRGCDHILHAGDITGPEILAQLSELAPVVAVRGNNDKGKWADALTEAKIIQFEGIRVYMVHDLAELTIDSTDEGVKVVVSGHSHRPKVETRNNVLYVNPGSAGPRRFKLPIAVGELVIDGQSVKSRIVELDCGR